MENNPILSKSDPSSFERSLIAMAVESFLQGQASKHTISFHEGEVKGLPAGKWVCVTMEIIDAGVVCNGGNEK